jgi:hypothetical protein
MFYEEVFKALNKARVKYVVVGGVAVVLHGYPRLTQDLDLIVFLEENNLARCFDVLAGIGYAPKAPVTRAQFLDEKERAKWGKEKGMTVFSFVNRKPPFNLVDIFIKHPFDFEIIYSKRKVIKAGGISIPIMDIDHLIRIKRKAGRGKDLDDIVQLNAIKKFIYENENAKAKI